MKQRNEFFVSKKDKRDDATDNKQQANDSMPRFVAMHPN